MAERDRFELDLASALRAFAEDATTQVRPAELARRFAVAYPHGRTVFGPWHLVAIPRLAWLLLLTAALLAATVAGALFVGSQEERKPPVVVPPVAPSAPPAFACPPGSTPNEPGPINQARPSVYGWSPMAFDRRAGKLIALQDNQTGSQETWTVETWTFDVCTNTWTRMHPNREPPALVSGLVYDADSDLTIGVHYKDWVYPPVTGSVWTYDLEANTWAEQRVAPTNGLGFYDPVSGLVVAGGVAYDLRSYDVETDAWTPIHHTTPWEDLGYSEYVYDASVDRIVEYAGGAGVAETWLFDIRASAWSRSSVETPVFEMGMWATPAIVYDEAAERTVVAGSFKWGAYDATADRWEILFDADPGGLLPGPTVYDPVNRRLLLFGGGIGVSGDLVAFDLVTRDWTVLLESGTGQAAAGSE
jgi:hypothetical protein